MGNTMEAVKKYWPWAIGLLALLWLMNRNSGSSGGDGGFYAAQMQGQLAGAQLGLQSQQVQASIDSQARADALQKTAIEAQAQVGYLQASAAMADAVGKSASGVVGALYAPAITAMQAGAIENASVMSAAAGVAIGGFNAQAGMVQAGSGALGAAALGLNTWGGTWNGIAGMYGGPPQKSTLDNVIETGTRAAAAYYTGGASEAYRYAS